MKKTPTPVDLEVLGKSTYLTLEEASRYLRFPSADAFRVWVSRHPIPKCRAGRRVLFFRKDLDAAVRPAYAAPPKKSES
jgi:excisionase family DNA binding protein